jgi:hypothetical protein
MNPKSSTYHHLAFSSPMPFAIITRVMKFLKKAMDSFTREAQWILVGLASAAVICVLGVILTTCSRDRHVEEDEIAPPPPEEDLLAPVRPEPDQFRVNTYMPSRREGETSGSIELGTFSPGRDLVYVNDERVWWESDNDKGDTEDDHSMHQAIVLPLRRLIEMVAGNSATLKVQDAYRPSGVHNPRSLHLEGRALDLTCDDLGLEKLAKLCWAAGFDWVYYESKAGGPHVHVSVQRTQKNGSSVAVK